MPEQPLVLRPWSEVAILSLKFQQSGYHIFQGLSEAWVIAQA
jgi:hypothetical protein